MVRQLISSGSRFEEIAGYSRAVVDDDWVTVSGTVGIDPELGRPPESARDQLILAFNVVERALEEAGASLDHVTHYRLYVTAIEHLAEVLSVCRDRFVNIRPANTTLICGIPVEGAKVEIELMAYRPRNLRGAK
jgi:enamine deaminase RidA (YjgF/YER057c/UK114 family)